MSDNLNTLGSLFEESVKRNEERIALSFVGNKGITYDEMEIGRAHV